MPPDTFESLAARLQAAGVDVRAAIERGLRKGELVAVRGVKECFATSTAPDGTPWVPLAHARPTGPGKPLIDTGVLQASVSAQVRAGELTLGTNRADAPLHQYGGELVPKRAKYLAIPATVEAKRAGSPRRFPGELTPRIGKTKRGGVMLDAAGTVQFYLTKGPVKIPARPFIGFTPKAVRVITAMVLDEVTKAITTGGP